jgi:hypothetical protein
MAEEEFRPLFDRHVKSVFEGTYSYALADLLSADEQERIKILEREMGSPYKFHIGAFDKGNEFVGWIWG